MSSLKQRSKSADFDKILAEVEDGELALITPEVYEPLLSPARYKGAHGGRGSGKSHFFCEMLVEEHLERPGQRSVCIREVQATLEQSVKRLLEDKIKAMGVGSYFDVQANRILCPGDGIIIFNGMQNHTAESIKSLEGYDRAFCEEAQTMSQRSLDLLRPTIRKPMSQLWFAWNPSKATDPIDKLLRGKDRIPNSIIVEANYMDNPFFPDVLREEMEYDKRRDPEKYAHIWLGKYQRNSEARVFKNWKIGTMVVPPGCRPYYGADWGFSVDPAVLVRCYVIGRTLYIDAEAYKVGCEIDKTPELFDQIDKGEARKWPIIADSARPETISYMRRHGYPKIGPAKKGAGSLTEGVEFLKNYDIVVNPRCIHVIDELTLYSYVVEKLTGDVLPKLADKKNHTIDALRYAVETLRRSLYGMMGVVG